jgi:hypothetical protein
VAAKPALRIEDGHTLSVRFVVPVFDHATRPEADDLTGQDNDCAIALIAPGQSELAHGLGFSKPADVRVCRLGRLVRTN